MAITIPQGNETAGTLVTIIRDLVPDPTYNASGVAQPDSDGSFLRAQTLYRFLSDAIRDMSRKTHWNVEDWWAMPLVNFQESYALDARWHNISSCFVNQYWCTFVDEPLTIWPAAQATTGSQSVTFGWHKRAGILEVSLWPQSASSDPTTLLNGAITSTTDTIVVDASTNFLSYGWLRIENELLQYQVLGTNQVSVCRRGAAGTTAASHADDTPVYHCGLWLKGIRTPNPVTVSTDPLEVPLAFLNPLQLYVLARVKDMEQERELAQSLQQQYERECLQITSDPLWQNIPPRTQVNAYGGGYGGGIYFYDPLTGGVVVP